MLDKRINYNGNIPTDETTIFTSPTGRRSHITGLRLINPTSNAICGRFTVDGADVFLAVVPAKDGVYETDTRLELLPGQALSVSAEAEGLKYYVTIVEVGEQ